jgi:hypothetical protein
MVITGLHLQAVAVLNVRQLVNIVFNSYSMEQALQRYALIKLWLSVLP